MEIASRDRDWRKGEGRVGRLDLYMLAAIWNPATRALVPHIRRDASDHTSWNKPAPDANTTVCTKQFAALTNYQI